MRDTARAAQERGSEAANQAQATAERGREQTSGALDQAAERLRERGDSGMAGQASSRAAEGMERTAGYLRSRDTNEMRDDMELYVRQHPMQAMGAAIVGGFLIGRILR